MDRVHQDRQLVAWGKDLGGFLLVDERNGI